MEDFNAGALPWCEFGNVESGSDRPTTSATFVSAQESLEGPTTPRNVVLQWPPAATIVGALIEALAAATACNDGEAIAAAVMHLAVLLDSACRDDGAAIGAAMRAGSALESLVRLLDHADQRVTQATLLLIGNLSTHDVDEAILLADKIILMTNGPRAKIAEIVVNTMPRSRTRHDLHKHPHYYSIRNHLIDFLVDRSKMFSSSTGDYDPRNPPLVTPGLDPNEAPAVDPVKPQAVGGAPLTVVR